MRVAAVQMLAGPDPGANRRDAASAVGAAAAAGADLVVLPEASLVRMGDRSDPWHTRAEALDGPFVSALAGAAARTGTVVVAGTFEPVSGEERVWNTVVVLGPEGLRGAYRKLHLFDALGWQESTRVRPGATALPEGGHGGPGGGGPVAPGAAEGPTTVPVGVDPSTGLVTVEVCDSTLGVATCYDLRFPELFRLLADRGADVIAVPAAWVSGPGKADQWTVLLRARAIENGCAIVAAGQPGPRYVGRSTVVDPGGAILAACDSSARSGPFGIALAEVDPERARKARVAVPVLSQRRFEIRARR